MASRKERRLMRAKKTRMKIKKQAIARLTVFKSHKHLYAQIITTDHYQRKDIVVVAASTLEGELRQKNRKAANLETAQKVGELIGQRAAEKGINKVAFDRSGYKFHGKIEALANGAKAAGLQF